MWGGEVGRGRDPEKCLCLSAEKPASLHSLLSLSVSLLLHWSWLFTLLLLPCYLPLTEPCSLKHSFALVDDSLCQKLFWGRRLFFFPFSKSCGGKLLSEVAPALTRQNACKLGDWRPKVSFKSFFFCLFFFAFFMLFQIQPNVVNEWVQSVCDRMHALFWCVSFICWCFLFILVVHVSHIFGCLFSQELSGLFLRRESPSENNAFVLK